MKIEIYWDVPEILRERFSGAIRGKQIKFSRGVLRRAQHAGGRQWRLSKKVKERDWSGELRSFVGRSNIYEKCYNKTVLAKHRLNVCCFFFMLCVPLSPLKTDVFRHFAIIQFTEIGLEYLHITSKNFMPHSLSYITLLWHCMYRAS